MSRFQERLWDELVRDHAATLAYPAGMRDPLRELPILEPRRVPLRGLPALRPGELMLRPGQIAATLALLAATVIAVAIFSTTGTTPSAAYAVTQNPDGTITVSVAELTGITGANEQLARLGVKVKVVPVQANCAGPSESVPTPPLLAAKLAHAQGEGLGIDPALVPSGDTLVLLARQTESAVNLSFGLYRGAAPACIAVGEDHVG